MFHIVVFLHIGVTSAVPLEQGHPLFSAGTATSGRAFKGDVTRKFTGDLRFTALLATKTGAIKYQLGGTAQPRFANSTSSSCRSTQWAVVTTIFEPSDAIRTAARLKDWCLVIVADEKTRNTPYLDLQAEMPDKVVYLSVAMQQAIMMSSSAAGPAVRAFMAAMPWSHFARKNIGYLFAIGQKARLIFDFDDDNRLASMTPMPCEHGQITCSTIVTCSPPSNMSSSNEKCTTETSVFNPYPVMGATAQPSWPRGFPLDLIKSRCTGQGVLAPSSTIHALPLERIGTIQLLADNDPDVDAIFRLTQPLPFTFRSPAESSASLLLPPCTFAPTNAQATIHTYDALWSTLLPVTVHGRVADIWRGYVAQRAFSELDLSVVFAPPRINQTRNAHNFLADMSAELDLYFKSGALVRILADHQDDTSQTLPAFIERLAVSLYERGFWGLEDVHCVQLWLEALLEMGYTFPKLGDSTQSRKMCPSPTTPKVLMESKDAPRNTHVEKGGVVLMGQFNYAPCVGCVETWSRAWSTITPAFDIIAAIPSGKLVRTSTLGVPVRIITYPQDKGYISPYTNLAHVIRSADANVRGVLYVHDDFMVTRSVLNKLGGFTWISTPAWSGAFGVGVVTRNGSIILNRKEHAVLNRWQWWDQWKVGTGRKVGCREAFSSLAKDQRMAPFFRAHGVHDAIPLRLGVADMLYVSLLNSTHTETFLTLLDVFAEHSLFLECAVPTALGLMRDIFDVPEYIPKLCRWDVASRVKPLPLCPEGTEVMHPIKLSKSLTLWPTVFLNITS